MTHTDTTQQLSLLPSASVPTRFHLSRQTRRRGLEHVAQLRAEMASRRVANAVEPTGSDRERRRPLRPAA